jgi:hypothetical protein
MPLKWFTSYFFYKTILDRRRYGTVRKAKICAMFLGIIIIVFMIASVVSAQVPDGWLKVKASFKGMDNAGAGKVSNATSLYIHTQYDTNTASYTIITCIQSPSDPDAYFRQDHTLPSPYVYALSDQEQIWNVLDGSLALVFSDGRYYNRTYPFLLMKTSSSGDVSMRTLGCSELQRFLPASSNAFGSCTLKGKTIEAEKVPFAARFTCLQ